MSISILKWSFLVYLFSFSLSVAFTQPYHIKWVKSYSGNGEDFLRDMIQNSDNNTVLLVESDSDNGLYATNNSNPGGKDIFFFEVNNQGDILKQFNFGTYTNETPSGIIQTCEDHYIIFGSKWTGANSWDAWIFMIDKQGGLIWEMDLEGDDYEYPYTIKEMEPGVFIALILSQSNTLDYAHDFPDEPYPWLIAFDANGEVRWKQHLKDLPYHYLSNLVFGDNAIYATGSFISPFPAAFNSYHHRFDGGIVKLSTSGEVQEDVHLIYLEKSNPPQSSPELIVYPNPARYCITFYAEDIAFPLEISLYNVAGQLFGSYLLESNLKTVDVSDLPAGAYLFVPENEELDAGIFVRY